MPNDAATLNPLEKVSAVEDNLKAGDSFAAQNVLNTVGAQQIFMDRLARVATADQLPGLQITSDDAGHAHQIKTPSMIISDADGHLSAHPNGLKNTIKANLSHAVDYVTSIPQKLSDSFDTTALGDCLKTSTTTNSCENRRIDGQIKRAAGE